MLLHGLYKKNRHLPITNNELKKKNYGKYFNCKKFSSLKYNIQALFYQLYYDRYVYNLYSYVWLNFWSNNLQ